jgi:4-hydroxy-4-methyl-2-oxoglutarate aldolase
MKDAAELVALGTATLADAWPAAQILSGPIRPLAPGMACAGPAFTVRCKPGDNLALHRAMAAAKPGDVLVADYGGSTDSGPFGEIMALAARTNGLAGLVIDGTVRDSAQIAAFGFPVFCRGVNIRGTIKSDRGALAVPVTLGGVAISPGDIILADADAIITLPPAALHPALAAARARAAKEDQIKRRIAGGESTLQILGLEQGAT